QTAGPAVEGPVRDERRTPEVGAGPHRAAVAEPDVTLDAVELLGAVVELEPRIVPSRWVAAEPGHLTGLLDMPEELQDDPGRRTRNMRRQPRPRLGVDVDELPVVARAAGEVGSAAGTEEELASLGYGPRPDPDARPGILVEAVPANLVVDPQIPAEYE